LSKTTTKTFGITTAIAIAVVLTTLFVYLWGSGLNIKTEVYTEWLQFAISMLAGISIISMGRSIGTEIRQSRTWLWVGLGFIFWSLGMLAWAIVETTTGHEPAFPSYLDIGFMLMYLLIIIAFFFQLRAYKSIIKPTFGLIATILAVAIVYVAVIWVDLISNTGLALALHVYYTIGGIAVVTGSILMYNLTKSVSISRAWILLAISLFLITFNNSIYHLLEHLGWYDIGQWKLIDLMTIAGFLLSWIGATRLKDSFK
jgi:hypothetical protein